MLNGTLRGNREICFVKPKPVFSPPVSCFFRSEEEDSIKVVFFGVGLALFLLLGGISNTHTKEKYEETGKEEEKEERDSYLWRNDRYCTAMGRSKQNGTGFSQKKHRRREKTKMYEDA